MRVIALLVVVFIVLAFIMGWWYVRDSDESIDIIIDKEEVREDVDEVVETGRDLIEDARERIEQDTPPAESEPPPDAPAGAPEGAGPWVPPVSARLEIAAR